MNNLFISSFNKESKYKPDLRYVFGFLVFFVSFLIYLEILNSSFFVKRLDAYTTLDDFLKEKNNIETVFLGSSHFYKGINTDEIGQKVFNLSFGGRNYFTLYYFLKAHIKNMPSLKRIILEADHHNFTSYVSEVSINHPFIKYVDFFELLKIKGPLFILSRVNYLTVLDERLGKSFFIDNALGYLISNHKLSLFQTIWLSRVVKTARDRAKLHFEDRKPINQEMVLYFNKIINLCRENNIEVITLQMPVSKKYIKFSDEFKEGKELKLKVRDILANSGCKNYDYENLYSAQKSLFWSDGDHLTKEGAELFTMHLKNEKDLFN